MGRYSGRGPSPARSSAECTSRIPPGTRALKEPRCRLLPAARCPRSRRLAVRRWARLRLVREPRLEPPVARAAAARQHDPRRDPDRRVLLASQPRGPGGAGLSRRRERVHRSDDAADRAAAGGVVPGDARPDPGDGPLRARAAGRLALLSPHRGRGPVPDLLPAAGGRRGGRGDHPRPQPARERARLLPPRRLRGEPGPPAAGVRGGHQRRRGVHAVREGAGHRRAAGRDHR